MRIDDATGLASDIDVIRLLCPEVSTENAAHMLTRVLEKDSLRDTDDRVHGVQIPQTTLAERVRRIKINGKGHETPVSDAKTIVEIIWLLPAGAAREFRRQSAETITRVLGGDISLCEEIEARCATLQSTEQGRETQEFLLHGRKEAIETLIRRDAQNIDRTGRTSSFPLDARHPGL